MANITPSNGDPTKTSLLTSTSKATTSTLRITANARTSTLDVASSEAASSSSILWGSVLTAPSYTVTQPTPSTPPHDRDMSSQPTAGFSTNAKRTVIVVTTIGGTFILAFLIYALWRRRKGHSYSEIVHFRRHSGTIILGSTRDERMTALPIYHETRYSVRSSKHGSTLSLGKHTRRPSAVPPAVAQRFYAQNPWVHDDWRPGDPPTPTSQKHPLSQVTVAEAPLPELPEMVRVYSSHGTRKEGPPLAIDSSGKPDSAVSVRPVSREERKENESLESAGSKDQTERWSWTNSQAPPTPRMDAPNRASLQSSLSSAPRFRKVKSWVRHQSVRHAGRIDEERASHGRTTSTIPILKNKASKPNLAPRPTRKLSKKSLHREDSSSLIIQSTNDLAGPARPPSAKVRENLAFRSAQY